MNTDKAIKALLKQVADLTAQVESGKNAPAPKADVKAKAKKALWETVAEKRVGAKDAKVGRIVTHGRIAGRDYVSVGKTVGGKTVKAVAVPADALKAALASFDL